MRRYIGRIVGTAVGGLAGPAGALFGLLAGWLVDQFRSSVAPDRELRRFLRNPRSEKQKGRAQLYALCAFAAAILIDEKTTAAPVLPSEALAVLSEGYGTLSRGGVGDGAVDKRLIAVTFERCASMRRIIDIDAVASAVDGRSTGDLLTILVRIAGGECGAASTASRATFLAIARSLAVDESAAMRLAERTERLDERACRILGVDGCADEAEVRGAFRALVRHLHPDGAGALEEAQRKSLEEALVRIRDAHDLLVKQLRRRADSSTRNV